MSQPLTLSQIIRYLVLGEKYAFLCSEIISSAIPSILETMVFDNKELLMVYWTLLYQEYRLTAPQINYFVKINQVLLNRRPGDMIRFIMTHLSDDLLAHWLYHFGDDQGCQLAELLVSLIQCELLSEGSGIVNVILSNDRYIKIRVEILIIINSIMDLELAYKYIIVFLLLLLINLVVT